MTWLAGGGATVTTLASFTPDVNGPPLATPWALPFSGFAERLPQSWDVNLRGQVEATIVDAWAGVNYTPNPILFTEILNDQPRAYWPCSDPAGSKIASNLTPGNVVPLLVTQSKYGTRDSSQTFGAATSTLPGTQGTLLLTAQGSFRSSTQSGMWQQSFTNDTPGPSNGYSLTCQGLNFPGSAGSLEFWFQTATAADSTTPAGGGPAALLMLGNNINQGGGFFALNGISVLLGAIPAFGGTGFLYLAQNSTLAQTQISGVNYWAAGTPVTHVCITWTTTTWTAYVNGQQTTTGSWPSPMPSTLSYLTVNGTNGYPYGLGTSNPSGTAILPYPGVTGHIALYDFILPQPRILTHYQAGFTAFAGELSSMRIERLLQAGQAAGRRLIHQEGGANVDAVVSCQDISGQPASQSVANITGSLIPAMFAVTPGGDLYHLSKELAWNQPVRWFLGENAWAGEITYEPGNVIFEYDPSRIANQIQITQLDRQDIIVPSVTAQETASRLAYGTVPYQQAGYLEGDLTVPLSFGPGLLDLADWLATRYATPALRLSSVTVEASSQPSAWRFVLTAAAGDMIQVTRRPIGQQPFSVTGRISQTERKFSFGYQGEVTAKLTCIIDPAPEYLCLTCDDPVRGVLNGTTNLLGW